jgi:DNA-binding MarR family transcriptional regulator
MRALDIIGRDGPLAPTALARRLGFTTGGVTTVIDRLERAGYARRRPDPADRRRLAVEITEATMQRDQEVFGGLIQATSEFVRSYSDSELAIIQGFLDTATRITANYTRTLADTSRSHR